MKFFLQKKGRGLIAIMVKLVLFVVDCCLINYQCAGKKKKKSKELTSIYESDFILRDKEEMLIDDFGSVHRFAKDVLSSVS